MKKLRLLLVVLMACTGLMAEDVVEGCTTFSLRDRKGNFYFGQNFDFPTGLGHVQVNLRGIRKTSFLPLPEKPFSWISRYGSISFNQNGREFPYSGMNEAGLVIAMMMLDESTYPQLDDRFGLEELQWVQYQLDVSATVEDVIASDRRIRISSLSLAPLHFLVSDARGNAAAIEYLNGKMVCHTGSDLVHSALANSTYADSLAYFNRMDPVARDRITNSNGRVSSEDRFVRAAQMVESFTQDKSQTVDYAFDILSRVAQGGTQWSTVYDLKQKTIYFKTRKNTNLRTVQLARFDFDKTAKRLYCDIDDDIDDVSAFKEYDAKRNLQLIDTVWNSLDGFLKDVPYRDELARYPDEVNDKKTRTFVFSAARQIVDLLKRSDFRTAKPEIQKIIAAKDKYYFALSEFVFSAMNLAGISPARLPDAIEVLKITVDLFPTSARAYFALGKAWSYAGNAREAIASYEKSLQLNPGNQEAKWDLEGLKAGESPFVPEPSLLAPVVGEYGERTIASEKGVLVYQRPGQPKITLIPMDRDLFKCQGIDSLRIRFVRENESVAAMECLYSDGRTLRYDRTK